MFEDQPFSVRLIRVAEQFSDARTEAQEAELRSEMLRIISSHGYPVESDEFQELFNRLLDAWMNQPLADVHTLMRGLTLLLNTFDFD